MKRLFKELPWNIFFKEKMTKLFSDKKRVIDIGGGLRIDSTRNNRFKANPWLEALITKSSYEILDKVPDYNPDIVGDIHALPFENESIDAIICMNILEHVEDPQKAMSEMFRVLKKGGYLYLDTPFIFYYHPMKGYYKDFFRFTRDAWEYMTRDFSHTEIQNVGGAISTCMNMFPLFSKRTYFFDLLDILFKKQDSNQTRAYRVFCIK